MDTQARSTAARCRYALLACALGWHLAAGAQAPDATPAPAPDSMSVAASASAASAASAPAAPVAPGGSDNRPDRGEPAVVKTVVEDDGTRIDELKIRGQSKRVTVTPKKIGKPYEIIPPSNGRDQSEGAGGSNGAAGKRVWPVLSF
jgi:hypothetical protein